MSTLHEQLMKAFQTYFEENQKYETRTSVRACRRVRKVLTQIRRLISARQQEVLEVRRSIPVIPRNYNIVKYNSEKKNQDKKDS